MHYLIWVPLTLIYNYLMCLLAVRYTGKNFLANYAFMTLCAVIPSWSVASYFSKNLVFDSLLYDSILVFSSVVFFIYLGQTQQFAWFNWLGVSLALSGLLLVRL